MVVFFIGVVFCFFISSQNRLGIVNYLEERTFEAMKKIIIPLFFIVSIIGLILVGCGGSGGGEGLSPVAATTQAQFANLSGKVTYEGGPMSNVAVYLIKPQEALTKGLTQALSIRNTSAIDSAVRADVTYDENYGDYRTMSDQDGSFLFSNVPVGDYTLVAVKDAAHQSIRSVVVGAITTVDVALTPTGNLKGSVVVQGGGDPSSLVVYLEGTSYVAVTSANGAFSLSNIPVGSYTIMALKAGYTLAIPLPVTIVVGENTYPTPIQMIYTPTGGTTTQSTGNISGTVVLEANADPSFVIVYLEGTSFVSITNGSGSFQLTDIPVGQYNLVANKAGFQTPSSIAVTVSPGVNNAIGTISLLKTSPTGSAITAAINGTAQLKNQSDHSSIRIQFVNTPWVITVDRTGNYTFSGIPLGTYRLKFYYNSSAFPPSWMPAFYDIDITQPAMASIPSQILLPLSEVKGTLNLSVSGAFSSVNINLLDENAVFLKSYTFSSVGTTTIDLPSGTYQLQLDPTGGYLAANPAQLAPFTITTGQTINRIIDISRGNGVIGLNVTGIPEISGKSYPVTMQLLRDSDNTLIGGLTFNSSQTALLTGISDGQYKWAISPSSPDLDYTAVDSNQLAAFAFSNAATYTINLAYRKSLIQIAASGISGSINFDLYNSIGVKTTLSNVQNGTYTFGPFAPGDFSLTPTPSSSYIASDSSFIATFTLPQGQVTVKPYQVKPAKGNITLTMSGLKTGASIIVYLYASGTAPVYKTFTPSALVQTYSNLTPDTYQFGIPSLNGYLVTNSAELASFTVTSAETLPKTLGLVYSKASVTLTVSGLRSGLTGTVQLLNNLGTLVTSLSFTSTTTSQTFSDISTGTYSINIDPSVDYLTINATETAQFTLAPGDEITRNLALIWKKCEVSGNVGGLNSNYTDPAIRLKDNSGAIAYSGPITAGSYVISSVATGTYSVFVSNANYFYQGASFTLIPGDILTQNITLTPTYPVISNITTGGNLVIDGTYFSTSPTVKAYRTGVLPATTTLSVTSASATQIIALNPLDPGQYSADVANSGSSISNKYAFDISFTSGPAIDAANTDVGPDYIMLAWNTLPGAESYNVTIGTMTVNNIAATQTYFLRSGLISNTNYSVSVNANAAGISASSVTSQTIRTKGQFTEPRPINTGVNIVNFYGSGVRNGILYAIGTDGVGGTKYLVRVNLTTGNVDSRSLNTDITGSLNYIHVGASSVYVGSIDTTTAKVDGYSLDSSLTHTAASFTKSISIVALNGVRILENGTQVKVFAWAPATAEVQDVLTTNLTAGAGTSVASIPASGFDWALSNDGTKVGMQFNDTLTQRTQIADYSANWFSTYSLNSNFGTGQDLSPLPTSTGFAFSNAAWVRIRKSPTFGSGISISLGANGQTIVDGLGRPWTLTQASGLWTISRFSTIGSTRENFDLPNSLFSNISTADDLFAKRALNFDAITKTVTVCTMGTSQMIIQKFDAGF